MVEHGFYNFLNWFDERAWYPLGRIVGGTVRVSGNKLHFFNYRPAAIKLYDFFIVIVYVGFRFMLNEWLFEETGFGDVQIGCFQIRIFCSVNRFPVYIVIHDKVEGSLRCSGNTLASHLWGQRFKPQTLSGKVGSCLPMVDGLQYRVLTPIVCTGFLCPQNYPSWYDLYSVESDVKPPNK